MSDDLRTLSREVEVTLIPQGTPMTLPEGEQVTITHRLGGNFTVMTANGMFRISGANADGPVSFEWQGGNYGATCGEKVDVQSPRDVEIIFHPKSE